MALCYESQPAPEYIIYLLRRILLPLVIFTHLQFSFCFWWKDSYLGLSDGEVAHPLSQGEKTFFFSGILSRNLRYYILTSDSWNSAPINTFLMCQQSYSRPPAGRPNCKTMVLTPTDYTRLVSSCASFLFNRHLILPFSLFLRQKNPVISDILPSFNPWMSFSASDVFLNGTLERVMRKN